MSAQAEDTEQTEAQTAREPEDPEAEVHFQRVDKLRVQVTLLPLLHRKGIPVELVLIHRGQMHFPEAAAEPEALEEMEMVQERLQAQVDLEQILTTVSMFLLGSLQQAQELAV